MKDQEVEIRAASPEDAAAILEIYAPYILNTAVTFEKEVPTLEEFTWRIRDVLRVYPYLVAVREDRIIGYCYAHRFRERAAFDWSAEVSLYVHPDFHGQGVGGRLYRRLEAAMKAQGIRNSYACIVSAKVGDPYVTDASPAFHEHVGYTVAGTLHRCGYKFHRWYDMLIMEKSLGNHREDVNEVVSFQNIH